MDENLIYKFIDSRIYDWVRQSRDIISTLMFQYGASRDEYYLNQCKNIGLYKILPISDIILKHIDEYKRQDERMRVNIDKSMRTIIDQYVPKHTGRDIVTLIVNRLKDIGIKMIDRPI